MTVGEKIRHYRKLRGLSQEELGQKLMVSRQTISLWENDQTLPTIDNLIQLKEIFGISIDCILCQQAQQPQDESRLETQDIEKYTFTFAAEDMAHIQRAALRPIRNYTIGMLLLCVLPVILFVVEGAGSFIRGFLLAMVLVNSTLTIPAIKRNKTAWRKNMDRIVGAEYVYEVHNDYLCLNIYAKGSLRSMYNIPFFAIENVRNIGGILTFQAFDHTFLMRESAIGEDSALYQTLKRLPIQQSKKPQPTKWKKWSIALFVATLLTLHGALAAVAGLSAVNHMFVENTWIFFLFLPIPAASIVLGFALKARGYKWKKNVIAGFIVGALLVIYGSFAFLFSDVYDHSDAYITTIENYTDMDIPQHSHISTQDWSKVTHSNLRANIYYSSDIYFGEAEAAQFETQLRQDPRWKTEVKNEMVGLLSGWNTYAKGDYVSLFNISENEFNAVPSQNGTYRFLSMFYDPDENVLRVVEYDIEYLK